MLFYPRYSVKTRACVGAWSQTERLMDSGQFDNTDYIRSYLSVIILLHCSTLTYKHNHRNISRHKFEFNNVIRL